MTKKLDDKAAEALREDARSLEQHADSVGPYPKRTTITRPNAPSRMFNLRLSDEQFEALQQIANAKHLPMSTMARAWLLDRLDDEQHATPRIAKSIMASRPRLTHPTTEYPTCR